MNYGKKNMKGENESSQRVVNPKLLSLLEAHTHDVSLVGVGHVTHLNESCHTSLS